MTSHRQSHPPYGVAIGLAAGMVVGAGVAIWLAQRLAAELRERITDSAKSVARRTTSDHYEQASSRALEAVEGPTRPRAL